MNQRNKEKEIYNTKICSYCVKNNTCNHDKFRTIIVADKTTIKCNEYEYINMKGVNNG